MLLRVVVMSQQRGNSINAEHVRSSVELLRQVRVLLSRLWREFAKGLHGEDLLSLNWTQVRKSLSSCSKSISKSTWSSISLVCSGIVREASCVVLRDQYSLYILLSSGFRCTRQKTLWVLDSFFNATVTQASIYSSSPGFCVTLQK